LEAFHAVRLVVNDNVLFIFFRWRIVCCRELFAKDGVEICLNVIFGTHVVIVVIVV
jgi:hypothetical protein